MSNLCKINLFDKICAICYTTKNSLNEYLQIITKRRRTHNEKIQKHINLCSILLQQKNNFIQFFKKIILCSHARFYINKLPKSPGQFIIYCHCFLRRRLDCRRLFLCKNGKAKIYIKTSALFTFGLAGVLPTLDQGG